MFKKLLVLILIFNAYPNQNSFAGEPKAVYEDAWMEQVGEYPVIHLKGTEQQMGEQLGYLAGDRFQLQINSLRSIGEKQYKDISKLPE